MVRVFVISGGLAAAKQAYGVEMDSQSSRTRIAVVVAGAAAAVAGTVGAAGALSGDDDAGERPIPAADLEQAEQAGLEEVGEGTVSATEVDDEESTYEVEVTLDDGSQVDVQLDDRFQVVDTEPEGDEGTDD